MLFKRKKETPVVEEVKPIEPTPEEAELYFKVYGTSEQNSDGSSRQEVLAKVATDIVNKVDPALLYHRLSDKAIQDIGKTVAEIDSLRYYMSIVKCDLGYDVVCKHGKIGYMPDYVVQEYEDLCQKYKKQKVNVKLSGGRCKYYDEKKGKICFTHEDYEAKATVYFKEPL